MKHLYDVIIIGGGPAGYTAALYATRECLDTILIEKLSAGGQMTQTTTIDNYPGFDSGIDGYELSQRFQSGAQRFGAKVVIAEVLSVELLGDEKTIQTDSDVFYGKTVIIATGAKHKHLGIEKEEEFTGHGVAYCASCDGMFYKDKVVAIVGGGNSAVGDALILSKICKKVYLIHIGETLTATKIYHDLIIKAENIEIKPNSTVSKILGENRISGVEINNIDTQEVCEISVDGLFISIGLSPETSLFDKQLKLNRSGYIIADESTKTNLDGVFAAGDVRTKEVRQIITAAGDGAVAAHFAEKYITQKTKKI